MAVHGMRRFAEQKPVFAAALATALLSSAALADPPQLTAGPTITLPNDYDFLGRPTARTTQLMVSERGLALSLPDVLAAPPAVSDRTVTATPFRASVLDGFVVDGPASYVAGSANVGFEDFNPEDTTTFSSSFQYSLTETVTTIDTQVAGSGITAIVRAGGDTLGQVTAATSADAQAAALSGVSTAGLPGRALAPVVNAGGTTETITSTTTSLLTGRDSYLATILIVPTRYPDGHVSTILVGNIGRCDQPFSGCEGGLVYTTSPGSTHIDTAFFQDLYVTTTTERFITSTGTVFVDIPLAGYGQAHPAAQAVGFELGGLFLRRLLLESEGAVVEEGDGGTAPFTVFIEAAGDAGRFGAHDGFAASDYNFAGVRGGIAFASDPQMTLGAAFEAGAWSWDSNDPLIPESADGETYKLGAFAQWRPGAWRVNAALFAGQQHVQGSTGATLGGPGLSAYNATVFGAGVEIGHEFAMAGLAVTPSAGLDVLGWSSPATSETGGLAPLTIAAASRIQARPNIGVKLAKRIALENGGTLDLGASAKLLWTLGDQARSVTSSGGTSYTVDGPTNGVGAEIGMNASVAVSQSASLTGAVAARFSESGNSFGGNVGFKMKF